jgi:hypothetical protein
MLTFQDFFAACAGHWTTERTYHFALRGEVERSYTKFQVKALQASEKQQILPSATTPSSIPEVVLEPQKLLSHLDDFPGFAISFETRSEKGEEVSMSLRALFIPDTYVLAPEATIDLPPLPVAAQVPMATDELIQGFYLRDEGYSESGAIAGRFTYQPTRQTLEMTTYYRRSVAVDQMRFVTPEMRLRTIVTYQRPPVEEGKPAQAPTAIDLVGFGVERKQ